MDTDQVWEAPQNKDHAPGLFIICLGYILFSFSALSYTSETWFVLLLGGRILAAIGAFVFGILLLRNKAPRWFKDTYFYTFCLGLQSLYGVLEPSTKADFYSYTGILFIIAGLSTRSSLRQWITRLGILQVGFVVAPLFFKDKIFFTSVGHFVDSFSLPVAGTIISLIIIWLNAKRFEALKKNFQLERLIKQANQLALEQERQRGELIQKELDAARPEMERVVKLQSMAQIAAQVAHDIRSPLSALDMVLKDLKDLPEEKRILVRSASQRIKDIANNLMEQHQKIKAQPLAEAQLKERTPERSTQLLSSLLDSIVSEKRIQCRGKPGIEIELQLTEDSYGLFAAIDIREMKRVMSNLINNSLEAMNDLGQIKVTLSATDRLVDIQIIDNGKGIAPDLLPRLGQRGITSGKENTNAGAGLGLYHARTTLESWGGSLNIESTLGKGTKITLSLPKQHGPKWFVERLNVREAHTVVVLDDDVSIHQVWDGRFASSASQVKLVHFSSPDEFSNWHKDHQADLYLVDYELLGHKETGLDVIERLALQSQAILVTSRFEENHIQLRCDSNGIRLLPKGLASLIPIRMLPTPLLFDAILIDDDTLMHTTWKMSAKTASKKVLCFATFEEFWTRIDEFDPATPIYIDSNLGNGVKGENVSRHIKDKGFQQIYLATGSAPEHIVSRPWITKIVGKAAPF